MVNREAYQQISKELTDKNVTLVAVSKIKPVEDIMKLYELGQRDFGENYVQELLDKASKLPTDIRWHFIGHLQRNKVKLITPFVYLIHGVDSSRLLEEINKQAIKENRKVNCLLQVHIASEETKFGLDEKEFDQLLSLEQVMQPNKPTGVNIRGLMGMASFTDDEAKLRTEFRLIKALAVKLPAGEEPVILSMGMSGDYKVAIEEGSTMVRIGSLLFGHRTKST